MERSDSLMTITSIGLLAYASADMAHHLLGHATACLMSGGQVRLATSQVVLCTVTGSTVDLAGPFASLLLGLAALLVARSARVVSRAMRLLFTLAAAFNLFWFNLQLTYSAASRKDDWAWAIHEVDVPTVGRYFLIAVGVLGYLCVVRVVARCLRKYAAPRHRLIRICVVCWLAAGVLACLTATLDHEPGRAIRGAVPQAMFLSIGLLFVPGAASTLPNDGLPEPPIAFSPAWVIAAVVISGLSIFYLGPGISL